MFTVVVLFFVLAVAAVAGHFMYQEVKGAPGFDTKKVNETMTASTNSFSLLGASAIIFLVGAAVAAAAFAWKIRASPALIAISLFLLIPLFLLAVGLSAGWTDLAASSGFGDSASSITGLNPIMSNLPGVVLLLTVIVLVATYGGYRVSNRV